ncbi:sialidase family protein [Prosthecobacter sp.]|uniref:sialidase family protein n=1 Tax=Prosthecobacter sp. TaxID=1965333 RepID=UPI0037840BD6
MPTFAGPTPGTLRDISIPTVDISGDAARHVIIARGTEKEYQGHCDTVLMADGKTMFTAWCMNHAGHLGPLARSDDGGLTWTSPLSTPPDWKLVTMTTPVLHRLTDPQGVERLFIFGGCDFPGNLRSAFSTDLGKTWSPMKELGLVGEVAPKSILSFDGGKRLIMWSDRRDPKNAKDLHPVVWQSESLDGGLTWSKERVILVVPGQWAQPSVTRSDDGKQLVMLLRENTRQHHSLYSVSNDDARTWSEPKELPAALTGDRHVIKHAPDGRLVIAFRDMAKTSTTYGHYVAWVGTFDDIVNRREGQYRIKLLHNTKRSPTDAPGTGNTDCGYSDLELLGDGTLIATTYIQYAAGPEKSSVVSTRFKLSETDALAKKATTATQSLLPANWDPALAGDIVMQRLVRVSAPQVKGAHDAEFVCVGERAYIVEHDNDVTPGHGAGVAMYCVLTVVNLKTLQVEKMHPMAKAGQAFANITLPEAQVFVPRIIRKDEHTLRTYFCSQPAKEQAVTWYRDFDLRSQTFEDSIHKAKLKTAAGTFDMEPRHFHADAAALGFKRPAVNQGLYIFDSFKEFDGKRYIALNNFPGKQNALAVLHDDFATFEVIGHYNEPQAQQLSESAVNRLPDGTWMAIVRNDAGNYHFTTSRDGKTWTVAEPKPFVPNGLNSKPTFDLFGGLYYLGWQENTKIQNCNRSVFNVDISRDGKTWQRKYRFESPHSFQYPTFHEHEGTLWLTVTQSDHGGSTDRIMFGKLESTGQFEPQAGHKRIAWPAPPPPEPAFMKRGVKLFTDREYAIDEMPEAVRDLPFHRTSIEKTDVTVTKPGTLLALTPTIRPKASSQEEALQKVGFSKVDVPEVQFFAGEVNRVSLYRKAVMAGERLQFKKMVLLVLAEGAMVQEMDGLTPSVILNPGAEFQNDERSGAMIIGMDRTPKGRIWGCWTGTGDKPDGYFLLATSDNDGVTWSKPRVAVGARMEAAQKVSGALVGNLWTDPKGRLWLFFDQQLGDPQKRITNWFMRCDDPEAAEPVWSEPVMFAEGCTLNKPTVLKDGSWLLPVSDWHQKTCRVFESTDEGATWKQRGSLQFPDWEFDEHMMVELKDGRLWMLARTKGQPHESFSTDGGKTWSEPKQAATVQNVNARFFLRRLKSGRILLVKNGSPAERLAKRTHMSAWLSEDEGQTWKGGLLLDERNAVSYPDGFESPDGLIHILYDWNRHTDAEILMAKFREEDLLAGKIVSKEAKLLMLANKATGPKPEKLYNGIELPDQWPPRYREPSDAVMEVPYLKKKPKVIPIDLGRQLFVDDFLIEKTTLKRTFHQAKKFEGNPVFKAETERELGAATQGEKGEEATTFTGQGGVFYYPAEKLFKMFYVAGWRGPLSLATSPDMKTWTRKGQLLNEGLRWTGPKLVTGGSDNCVWLDLNAKSPAEQIKYLTCWLHVPKEQRPQGFMHSLHVSDGKTFSDAVTTSIEADDYCSFFYNPFREKWVFSIKMGTSRGRSRYYYESDDFLKGADWKKSVFWTCTDKLDLPEPADRYPGGGEPAQLYSLNAVAYESLMVGMHYIHRGPNNGICDKGKFPKLVDLELGFSRDGFHWDRPDRRGFIVGSRTEGSWDRAYLHGAAGVFVVLDDQLVFPYMGTSGIAPSGHRGMYTGGSIGLATLRRDGFASMEGPGELTTRPVKFKGKNLFVNVHGEVRVEVLDEAGRVLKSSKVASGDQTKLKVEWSDASDLSDMVGRNVKFRFHQTKGSLYAFWVTSDENGASGGYVGAGGPAFNGVRDTSK